MRTIRTHSDLTVPVEHGRASIELAAGIEYVMHDVEVVSGEQAGVFAAVGDVPPVPRPFAARASVAGSCILPFIGGLGDAVALLPVLGDLRRRWPEFTLTISTTPGPAGVFALSDVASAIVPYPMTRESWAGFDHFLSMECVHDQPAGRGLTETFAAALGIDPPASAPRLAPPADVVLPVGLDGDQPRVVVAVADGQTLRGYPHGMLTSLIANLASRGAQVVLVGHADSSRSVETGPGIVDLRSRTQTVAVLAAVLAGADAVVTHDCFVMHMASALGRPTVSLFAPTSPHLAPSGEHVLPVASGAPCAPCHEIGNACPLGHATCVAWEAESVSPEAIRAMVEARMASAHSR